MCGFVGFLNTPEVGSPENVVRAMADRIIHRGPDDADYYVDEGISLGFRRLSIIDLEGGRQPILNEDGTKVALMDNDAAVKAARFLYDLKFKYGVLPEESMALVGTEVRNQFIEGNIAIASMDAKSGTVLTDAGVNWDFIPSLEDETRATWIASDALIMNSASQNKELAASLIKYITSAEVMAKFHTEIAPFPPITRDEAYNDDERFKEMYEDAEHLHTLPVANGAFKVMDTLYKNLQLMMLGDLSPEEAIQNTVDYAESIG